jgi:hypothetical protein
MIPKFIEGGKIRIPVRVTFGDIIGDGFEDIDSSHPDFKEWETYLKEGKE